MAILSRLTSAVADFFNLNVELNASDPGRAVIAITKADADLAQSVRALYIGGEGNVVIRGVDQDNDVTLSDVPAGTILPIAVKRVADATTATNIVGIL